MMGTTRVGVIGLGLMGSSMARLNVAAGHTVKGFDVDPDRADLIDGLRAAGSVAEAATDVDVVLLSLPNSGIGLEVTLGDGGIASAAAPGTVVADTSTADPAHTLAMANGLAEAGIGFVDSTVSGNGEMAAVGDLVVMVGGSADDIAQALPALEAIGRAVHTVGPVGSGARAKLIVNHALGIHRQAIAETLVVTEAAGIDMSTMLAVLQDSAAASKAMDIWGKRMIAGDHAPPAGHFSTSHKDAVLIAAQAEELGVPVALRDAVYANFKEGMEDGLADYDNSAVIEVIRRQIGQGRIPRAD